jgi:hypothetical protein
MKFLSESYRGLSLFVAINTDRMLVPVLIVGSLTLAGWLVSLCTRFDGGASARRLIRSIGKPAPSRAGFFVSESVSESSQAPGKRPACPHPVHHRFDNPISLR